jgi:hypothetical protein
MSSTKYYYKDGTTSSEYDNSKVIHRIDGPAIEYSNGYEEWYVDGGYYREEEFNKLIEEIRQLPLAMRLIDPREWVRKL